MNVLLFLISTFLIPESLCSKVEFVTRDEFNNLKNEMQGMVIRLDSVFATVTDLASLVTQLLDEKRENLNVVEPDIVTSAFLEGTSANGTIEERVAVLEFQVLELSDDVTLLNTGFSELGEDLDLVEGEIAVILAGQVIQDDRILELEDNTDSLEDSISTLEATDEGLSSSIVELDGKVSSLNVTVTEAVQDVMKVDLRVDELSSRVSELETNGTFAFHAVLETYTFIPLHTVVVFPIVNINLGNGYNGATGAFTVPTGGAGLYYFMVQALTNFAEYAGFDIRVNEQFSCYTFGDGRTEHYSTLSCGTVTYLNDGDVVDVFMNEIFDNTSIYETVLPYNTFTGIRIAPE